MHLKVMKSKQNWSYENTIILLIPAPFLFLLLSLKKKRRKVSEILNKGLVPDVIFYTVFDVCEGTVT